MPSQCPINMNLKEYTELATGLPNQSASWLLREFAKLQEQIDNINAGVGMTVRVPDGYSLNLSELSHTGGRIGSLILPVTGTIEVVYGRCVSTYLTATVTVVTPIGNYTSSVNPEDFSGFANTPASEGDFVQIFLDGDVLKPGETVGSFESLAITLRMKTPPTTYVGTTS